jgi:hypothetical protein
MESLRPQPPLRGPAQVTQPFELVDVDMPESDPERVVSDEQPLHVVVVPRYGETMMRSFDDHGEGVKFMSKWVGNSHRKDYTCEVYAFVGRRVAIQYPQVVYRFDVSGDEYEVQEA